LGEPVSSARKRGDDTRTAVVSSASAKAALRRLSGKNALDEQLGIGLPCGGRDTLK
jgi:hypothetical protein